MAASLSCIDQELNAIFNDCSREDQDVASVELLASACAEKYASGRSTSEKAELKQCILKEIDPSDEKNYISRSGFLTKIKECMCESLMQPIELENTSHHSSSASSDSSGLKSDEECFFYHSTPSIPRRDIELRRSNLHFQSVILDSDKSGLTLNDNDMSHSEREAMIVHTISLKGSLTEVGLKYQTVKKENNSLLLRLAKTEERNQSLELKFNKLNIESSQKIDSLISENTHLRNLLTEAQEKLARSERECSELKADNQVLKTELKRCDCKDIQPQYEVLQKEMGHLKTKLSSQIREKDFSIVQLKKQLNKAEENGLATTEQISSQEDVISTLNNNIQELVFTIETLRTEKQDLQLELSEAKALSEVEFIFPDETNERSSMDGHEKFDNINIGDRVKYIDYACQTDMAQYETTKGCEVVNIMTQTFISNESITTQTDDLFDVPISDPVEYIDYACQTDMAEYETTKGCEVVNIMTQTFISNETITTQTDDLFDVPRSDPVECIDYACQIDMAQYETPKNCKVVTVNTQTFILNENITTQTDDLFDKPRSDPVECIDYSCQTDVLQYETIKGCEVGTVSTQTFISNETMTTQTDDLFDKSRSDPVEYIDYACQTDVLQYETTKSCEVVNIKTQTFISNETITTQTDDLLVLPMSDPVKYIDYACQTDMAQYETTKSCEVVNIKTQTFISNETITTQTDDLLVLPISDPVEYIDYACQTDVLQYETTKSCEVVNIMTQTLITNETITTQTDDLLVLPISDAVECIDYACQTDMSQYKTTTMGCEVVNVRTQTFISIETITDDFFDKPRRSVKNMKTQTEIVLLYTDNTQIEAQQFQRLRRNVHVEKNLVSLIVQILKHIGYAKGPRPT